MLLKKSSLLLAVARGLFQAQTTAAACSKVVHCRNGYAYHNRNGNTFSDATGKTCVEECGGNCCTGPDSSPGTQYVCGLEGVYLTAFSVCADNGDGSCTGNWACTNTGGGGVAGLISGGSCNGTRACFFAGGSDDEGRDGAIGNISAGSCIGDSSCGSAGLRGNAGHISNGSCTDNYACASAAIDGAIGDLSRSCTGYNSCMALGNRNPQFFTDAIFPMDNCCHGDDQCTTVGYPYYGTPPLPDDACLAPTSPPTLQPTKPTSPTEEPTSKPSGTPTANPSGSPSEFPSIKPTADPTADPSTSPTDKSTSKPSGTPTNNPSGAPTVNPSAYPTESPSESPSDSPTDFPTDAPTAVPTDAPTMAPTNAPTKVPSDAPTEPPIGCVPDLFEFGNCTKPLSYEECEDYLGHKWISNPIDPAIMNRPFDHLPGGCFAKRKNSNTKIVKVRYNPYNDVGTNCGQKTKGGKFTKLCVCCA